MGKGTRIINIKCFGGKFHSSQTSTNNPPSCWGGNDKLDGELMLSGFHYRLRYARLCGQHLQTSRTGIQDISEDKGETDSTSSFTSTSASVFKLKWRRSSAVVAQTDTAVCVFVEAANGIYRSDLPAGPPTTRWAHFSKMKSCTLSSVFVPAAVMKPWSETHRCEEIQDFNGQNYRVQFCDFSIVPMI